VRSRIENTPHHLIARPSRELLARSPFEQTGKDLCSDNDSQPLRTHRCRVAAKKAGAKTVEEPHETVYGEFQYAAIDIEGHLWLFSRTRAT